MKCRWVSGCCAGSTGYCRAEAGEGTPSLNATSVRELSCAAAMGFGPSEWSVGSDGEPRAASGLRLLPRDMLKIGQIRSEEHTSELQSHHDLVCRLLLEK